MLSTDSKASRMSTTSKSYTESVSSLHKKEILDAKGGVFDFLFPLYDNLTQDTRIYSLVYYIMMIIMSIQMYIVSIWPYSLRYLNDSDLPGNIVKSIVSIFQFVGNDTNKDNPRVYFWVLTSMFLLIILAFLIQFIMYHKKRVFSHAAMVFIRLVCECILPFSIIPISANLGWLLQLIINKESSHAIYYFFPTLVYYIFFLFLFWTTFTIISTSPFLSRSPIAMWDSSQWIYTIIVNSAFAFLDSFVSNFPRFTAPIIMCVHLICTSFFIYSTFTLYFVKINTSMAFAAVLFASAVADVFSVVYFAIGGFTKWIFIGIYIPLLIIGFIIAKLIYIPIRNRIAKVLSLPENDAREEYEKIGIKSFPLKAKAYLHVGILEISSRFIDFSYIKYILANVVNINVLTECLSIVCSFPQESRFMNQIFQAIITKDNLSMQIRFLLYQIERIKSVRQCSSVISSTEVFYKLTSNYTSSYEQIISIWRNLPQSTRPIKKLTETLIKTQNLWMEVLNAYPNNSRFREEYATFLVECECDFSGGILQKYKMQQIEQGMSFATDKAFKYFIANYPKYLKRNVMDFKGNILLNHDKKKGSSINSSSSNVMSFSSSSVLSDEIEQGIGKSMFNSSKTRIGLHYAFYNRKSTPVRNFRISGLIVFIIQVISTIIVFIMFDGIYKGSVESVSMVSNLNNVRFATNEGILYSFLFWAKARDLIVNPPPSFKQYDENDTLFDLNWTSHFLLTNKHFTASIQDFMQQVTYYALSGRTIENYIPSFVNNLDDVPEYFYNGMINKRNASSNLQKTSIHILSDIFTINEFKTAEDFKKNKNTQINELMANQDVIRINTERIINDIKNALEDELGKAGKFHSLIEIVFIIVVYLLTVPLFIYSIYSVFKEQETFLDLMRSFNENQILSCTEPIMIRSDTFMANNQITTMDISDDGKDKHICVYLMIIIFGGFIPILFGVGLLSSDNLGIEISRAANWIQMSSARKSLITECLNALSMAILLKQSDSLYNVEEFKFTNSDSQFEIAKKKLDKLIELDTLLNVGNDYIEPCKNIDKEIDAANSESKCSIMNKNNLSSHQFMKCASVSDVIGAFSTITLGELKEMNKIGEETFLTISHSFFNHLIERIDISDKKIISYADNINNRHHKLMSIGISVSTIFSFLCFVSIISYSGNFQNLYETLLHLLLRMNPSMIISNTKALNFLLNKKSDSDTTGSMTTARKILHHSTDPIICLGSNEAVELINKATTTLLGYTPEQVLGQGISEFFDNNSVEEIQKMIMMMKLNQAPMTYESHVVCLTDSDAPIRCKLTLIGMKGKDENKGANSFVIIVTDEEELAEGKKLAEEAKQKSETLLYHILPMDIVLRINRGENNISFTVPSATIVFTDIQRFSDFAKSMSPSQIMGALSLLFGSFDEILTRYPIILKIKLIGDIYMAAGGLFSPNEPPQKHAEACVKFAVEALQCLDEVNNKLSSNLNLRIGINTGGPIIAGVLGTDKPVFDIIGDPINVAARLQSTDIVGKIQISEATHSLINQSDYYIEKRNDVFLKGKGKSTAYLLSQQSQLAISSHFKTILSDENVLSTF